ncbi:putative outer membrane protein, probably involved in nutrient binding [Flavobacteriales bacterium ALC-1]|nr:putative outer membrane protein, probably involved in nutrient binding [Flavobacteriales bacterium ALC-1]
MSAIEIVNPLAQIENTFNTTRVSKIAATLGLDYTFWNNFKFSSKFQINHANVRDDIFRPEVDYGPGKTLNQTGNEIVDNGADFDDYTWDNYLTYTNTFNEKHNLTVLLGTSIFRTKGLFYGRTGTTDTNTNRFGDAISDLDGTVTLTPRFNDAAIAVGNNIFDDRLGSVFGRVQYNYNGKYLISVALRRDGSSKFAEDNRYGYFPTGSIGWNISDEPFLEDSSWLNSLKLRASYGVIGNDRIPSFGFVSLLTGEATYAPGNEVTQDDLLNGTAIGLIGNPSLKWEEQVAQNIGFDARLFDSKVSLSLDLFSRKTEDLLLSPQASGLIGSAAPGSALPFVNAGTVENKGIEISVGYNNRIGDDFEFNLGFNITTLDNKVVSLNGNIPPVGGEFGVGISQTGISRMIPGQPLGHFYGYKTDGIYQTQAEINALNASSPEGTYHEGAAPGDLKFVDVNGDGEITADDRTNIGDPIAEVTMGFNLGFQYKNIDFSATAFASIGNDMVRDYERKNLYANRGTYMLERWQGSGTSNSVPRAVGGASINTDLFSDFYVEDASFLRLQNVQVGYTFNEKQLEGLGVDKLRIYVSGNNLFTLSDYFGYDPSASNGAPIGSGIDKGFYPVAKSYLLGVNLNF